MLRQFPSLSRFFFKLVFELLPAAVVSGVGGMLVGHYINAFTTPAAAPATAVESSVSAEVMQMVRDEHDLIVDYLKKNNEARQRAERAAEQEAKRAKAAERTAALSRRETKPAETRAAAMPSRAAEKSETKGAAKQVAPYPDQPAMGEPVRAASVAMQIEPRMEPAASPANLVTAAAGSDPDEDTVKIKLRGVTATVERIPFVGHSVAELFSGGAPRRPLPSSSSPPSNWP
jgi:hypothetical protein